jgi:hypothetical protein
MNSRPTIVVSVGLLALALAAPAQADMYLVTQIDLGPFFGPVGNNPMTITADGTYAYIGGYNGSGAARTVGILKLNLADPNDAVELAASVQTVNNARFYDGLVYEGGILYALMDRPDDSAPMTNVRAIDPALDVLIPTFDGDTGDGNGIVFEPAALTVGATGGLAFDPGFGGNGTGLSLLGFGKGRRALLDIFDGSTIYDTGDGMAVADISGACTVSDQTAWRDHVYDEAGNVYLRRSNQVQTAVRSGPNAIGGWAHLTDELNADGTPKVGCGDGQPVALRLAAFVVGQHLERIPASSAATDEDLIIFNDRAVGGAGQEFANVVKVITTTGALPTAGFALLAGDGSPLVVPAGAALYDFFYTASADQLLVLDFANRLLLVFGPDPVTDPVCRGDLNCDGQVGFGDINPFVLRLSNPDAYSATYPGCPDGNGDVNENGSVGFDDINPFVTLMSSGQGPCQ